MLLNEWVYQSKYQEYEIKDVYVYIQSAETNAVTDPKQTNKQTNKQTTHTAVWQCQWVYTPIKLHGHVIQLPIDIVFAINPQTPNCEL